MTGLKTLGRGCRFFFLNRTRHTSAYVYSEKAPAHHDEDPFLGIQHCPILGSSWINAGT